MRMQHVEVTLVHRDIRGFAHRAARMVQPFRHVAKLHEVAEILHRRIAPPALGIPHERRTVDRCQDKVAPADLHVALRIAGVLHIA